MSIDIESPLSLEGFGFEPRTQQRLKLQDDVNWAFAVLTGRRGNKQHPLAADEDNRLFVNGSLMGYETGDVPPDEPSQITPVVLYGANFAGTAILPVQADPNGLYVADPNARSSLNDIEAVLEDVWDDVNHALQTKTV
jgi:hypothetical protein